MSIIRVLVTGCTGFIGSHLTDRLLKEGFEVVGIDCFTDYYSIKIKERNIRNALKAEKFKLIRKDILRMKEFPEVDYVFHQAAQPGVRTSWGKNFETYIKNNVLATQKLLEFYRDQEIKKFLFASSSSVYGNVPLPMKEDSLLRPISPYGVTKLAAENLCYIYFKNYGVPIVCLRYFTVYGPRQRPDMAIYIFVRAILNANKITVFGDGNQVRDFTYIDDVIEANILSMKKGLVGETFNIGNGSALSINDLIKKIEKLVGKEADIKYVKRKKGDLVRTLADISKARGKLGYNPKFNIERGLKNYITFIRDGR